MDGTGSWDVERGGYAFEGGADLQLGADTALRLAGANFDRHGWVRNGATGNDVPEDRDTGIRLTIRSQLTDQLSSVLRYQYSDRERLGTAMQLVGPPGSVPEGAGDSTLDDHSFAYTPRGPQGESHHDTRAHIASAHFDFRAGDHDWISETAWVEFDTSTLDDVDFSASPHVDFLRISRFHQFSQELRIASSAGETLEYMAGVSYLQSGWHSIETEYWNVPDFPPGAPPSGQLFNGPFTNDFDQDTRSASVFANGTWRPTDRMRVFAGLRLTDERKDVVYGRSNSAPFTLWNTAINPPFAPTPLEFDDQFLDGNLAVQFDLTDQATVYASAGRGNKLGGYVETNSVPSADPAIDARIGTETATSWELGARVPGAGRPFSRASNTVLHGHRGLPGHDVRRNGIRHHQPAGALKGRRSRGELEFRRRLRRTACGDLGRCHGTIGGQSFQLTQAPQWSGVASFGYSRTLAAGLRRQGRN